MTTRRKLDPYQRALRVVAVTAVLSLLCGCAHLASKARTLRLSDELRAYSKMMRWGNFAAAARYFRPRDPGYQNRSAALASRVRVTVHRLIGALPNAARTEAAVSFELRFFLRDTSREFGGVDQQVWYWDSETSQWFLDGTLPEFRRIIEQAG